MCKLKYFKEEKTERGYGVKGIVLNERIFSITKENDNIIFREECDGYFHEKFKRNEAIQLLQEAIEWIKR